MAVGISGAAPFAGHAGPVFCVAFSPGGTVLATGGKDGVVRLWDVATGQRAGQLTGHTDWVYALTYSRDGATIATASRDRTARLWNASTRAQVGELSGHNGAATAVAISPDGTVVATASDLAGGIRLWDAATRQQTAELTGRGAVAFSPDGAIIAVGSGSSGTVGLWDAGTREKIRQLTGHADHVDGIAFSPDGTTIATGGEDGTVRLWDAATGEQRLVLAGHDRAVASVAFSPDGTSIASGSFDGTVRLWDAATGQQAAEFTGHILPVNAVAYSPDKTTIATGGDDDAVRLWDAATGELRATLIGHTGWVNAVAYSPDGTTVASVGDDCTIRIWNPRNGAQVNGTGFRARRVRSRPLAGIHSDSPSAADLLGVRSDVETLAELIAASETRPPLAIALIGDWGAGKSSVMLQVEEQVKVIAGQSRNNPGLSEFAENVRQVRFNAWHYSDDHLWAGLVRHLFQVLAAPDDPAAGGEAPDAATIQQERTRLQAGLDAKQRERDWLARELKATGQAPGAIGVPGWPGSPWKIARILLIAARLTVRDVKALTPALLGWAFLGGMTYAAWRLFGTRIAEVVTGVAAVLAMTVPVLALAVPALVKLRSWHHALTGFASSQRARLTARQQKTQQEIGELREQLARIDAAARLAAFLDDRGSPATYREYQGLLGRVHADLERLSADLAQARAEWAAGGGFTPAPLERIVLYIDDLDRCPPRRVVEVLEAIHLMLALDLFVVVVAVDARWLTRSLEYHYHDLFSSDAAGKQSREDLTSPVDYLDKIFQIPYVLLPPTPAATARYLRAMLPAPAQAVEAAEADGEGTVPFGPIRKIRKELAKLQKDAAPSMNIAECQAWCPALARFSFNTRDLAGPPGHNAKPGMIKGSAEARTRDRHGLR